MIIPRLLARVSWV